MGGDVYSFGITLLELFTGKSPTHEGFTGDVNLSEWVRTSYLRDLMVQMDDSSDEEGEEISENKQMINCLIEVINIGLSCAADSADTRITMKDALSRLQNARHSMLKPT